MKKVIVYSSPWCRDCHAARNFLTQHKVDYQEVNIDEKPEAAKFVMQVNNGKRSVPTIDIEGTFVNGSPFTHEIRKKLAEILGFPI
jgi:glutaredoxin